MKQKYEKWAPEQIAALKALYVNAEWGVLIKAIGRSRADITRMACKLGIRRCGIRNSTWTEAEDSLLCSMYCNYPLSAIQANAFPNRSVSSICQRANALCISRRTKWSSDETTVLIENYGKLSVLSICELLPKRSRNAIILQAGKLGLENIYNRKFSKNDDANILKNYTCMSDAEIGALLSRTPASIKERRHQLGLLRREADSTKCYHSLSDYVRRNNSLWKEASMRECEYKCVITGKRFDDIHHLFSVNLMIQEACEIAGIDANVAFDEISEETKNVFLATFFDIQAAHPLGVCLSSDVHQEFHQEYGYGNNTPEQFREFMERYPTTYINGT